jgi:hypothetical protein
VVSPLNAELDELLANPSRANSAHLILKTASLGWRQVIFLLESGEGLGLKLLRKTGTLRLPRHPIHGVTQVLPLCLGIKTGVLSWRVIDFELFGDPAVDFAIDETGGHVNQSGVAAPPHKFGQMQHTVRIGGQRQTQIGIEIGQSRRIYYQIKLGNEPRGGGCVQAQSRLGHVALQDFQPAGQKMG